MSGASFGEWSQGAADAGFDAGFDAGDTSGMQGLSQGITAERRYCH